jgi:hypothetical protein
MSKILKVVWKEKVRIGLAIVALCVFCDLYYWVIDQLEGYVPLIQLGGLEG